MINSNEHITNCPRWAFCSTPLYTGRCSKICFEMRDKYERVYKTETEAKWKHRAEYNDFCFVECSNCGFRVENYKAVIMGDSDRDLVGVNYRFCPMCGKQMGV